MNPALKAALIAAALSLVVGALLATLHATGQTIGGRCHKAHPGDPAAAAHCIKQERAQP